MDLRILIAIPLLAASSLAAGEKPADVSAVLGVWEGESICMQKDSPCHDEHVVYQIKRASSGDGILIDASKVVAGKNDFMGTLECTYTAERTTLNCTASTSRG